MSWIYRISMKMKLFIALFPLTLALIWCAGSGMVRRIDNEQQKNTSGQVTTVARRAGEVGEQDQRQRGRSDGVRGAEGEGGAEAEVRRQGGEAGGGGAGAAEGKIGVADGQLGNSRTRVDKMVSD